MAAQTITRNELMILLANMKGAKPAGIITETAPKMQAGHPFGKVAKQSHVSVMLNVLYENAVNRQREREGVSEKFSVAPRQWGVRLNRPDGTLTPVVSHKGSFYLETKVERSVSHSYTSDGAPVDTAEVEKWLPPKRQSSRQGTEKEVMIRTYKLESILEIRVGGQRYVIAD